jgi:hypothetical protein
MPTAKPNYRKLVRERRRKVIDSLLETLTREDGPTVEEIGHFRLCGIYFGLDQKIDQILDSFEAPDLRDELTVSIVCHCLSRLIRTKDETSGDVSTRPQ